MEDVDSRSKLCLRRMGSTSTLASPSHHSRLYLRDKSKKLKRRLRYIILSRKKSYTREDYFTQRLPAELRLLIYEHLLQFDCPLKLQQHCLRTQLQGIAILRVSRLTYKEALPVFYELNTIAAHRYEFCRFAPAAQLTCKTEWIRSLYVCDLDSLVPCLTHPWPPAEKRCCNCEETLFEFLMSLKFLPRIRKIYIDYCRHSHCVHALSTCLSRHRSLSSGLRMTCIGIGKYRLEGRWVGAVDFELRDTFLSGMWQISMARRRDSDGIFANRQSFIELGALRRRHGFGYLTTMGYMSSLALLFAWHDAGRMAANFARIWPNDIPMDFRQLTSQLGRPEFLHEFNVELQHVLEYSHFESTVPRRMN